MTDWTKKPGRRFSHVAKVPCPRCYAPLDHAGVCHSKGCNPEPGAHHGQRTARRMEDPGFRSEYNRASEELRT